MVDERITDLAALTGAGLATGDEFVVVDISDTSMDASGTDKKMTAAELVAGVAALGTLEPLGNALLGRRQVRPLPFQVRQLMAVPPVVGATASATAITSPQSFYALVSGGGSSGATVDPAAPFTYLGAGAIALYGTSTPDFNYVAFKNVTGSTVSPSQPYKVRFGFDGTQLEVMFKQLTGYGWEIWVEGQLVAGATASGSSPVSAFLPITFATRAQRIIEFRSQLPFRGVNVGPNDTVWAPPAAGPRVIVLGDSYAGGTGATIPGLTGWVQTFGDYMGWPDVWASALGGTGYLNVGSGSAVKLGGRLGDATSYAPDLIIVAMGHNDTGFTAGALTAEVAADLTTLKAGLNKGGKLIVVGPFFQGGAAATYSPIQAAIFSGAAGIADATIDTVTTPWFTGTGHVGATTGSGNSDLYIESGGVHPTQAGHDYLARRMKAAVDAILAA